MGSLITLKLTQGVGENVNKHFLFSVQAFEDQDYTERRTEVHETQNKGCLIVFVGKVGCSMVKPVTHTENRIKNGSGVGCDETVCGLCIRYP